MRKKTAQSSLRNPTKSKVTRRIKKPSIPEVIDLTADGDVKQNNGKFFRFFELPAELRNRMYHLAIPQGETFEIAVYNDRFNYPLPPALAHTYLRIRDEALPIWRSGNTFRIITSEKYMADSLASWLLEAGTSALEHMHLVIKVGNINARCCRNERTVTRGLGRYRVSYGRCHYDIKVELHHQKYEIGIRWHDLRKKCAGKHKELEHALAFSRAKSLMSAFEMVLGKKLTESDNPRQVHCEDGDVYDSEEDE